MPSFNGSLVSSICRIALSSRHLKPMLNYNVRCFSADSKSFHSATLPRILRSEDDSSSMQHGKLKDKVSNDTENINMGLLERIDFSPMLHIMNNRIATGSQDAFYVVDLEAISKRHALWRSMLPNVKPFYAVKCNPDVKILQLLQEEGCGFDCASKEEIEAVFRVNGKPSDVIYANPCKQQSHMEYAKNHGVKRMTFDSCDELIKIKATHPDSKLILRIAVDDSHSQCQFNAKFGAPSEQIPSLLACAKKLQLNLVGVSFHVGSGCFSTKAYSGAVETARSAFNMAKQAGYDLKVLDIGGGFPGDDKGAISFEDIATELAAALEHHFPPSSGIEIIAEPGRFFVAGSHTLAVNVIGRKLVSKPVASTGHPVTKGLNSGSRHLHASSPHYMYYVNDGLYGSFNCVLYDHAYVSPKMLQSNNKPIDNTLSFSCSVWGPTCDGLDCITREAHLPIMSVGQWMYFEQMGAYTTAAGSCFNGFQPPQKMYVRIGDYN